MRKKRYYLDTSVWVGIATPRVMFDTFCFFDMVLKNQIVCLYSDIVEDEMVGKSKKACNVFRNWPSELREKLNVTPDILKLADTYISQGVVGKTSRNDCIHIAAATVNGADVLVSWNFKHIVNVHRVRGYNSVNMDFGYPILEIRSPSEVVEYGTY